MKTIQILKLLGTTALLAGLCLQTDTSLAANWIGDGHDDLLVGAPGEALGVGPRSGAAYLYRGYSYGVASAEVIDQGGLDVNELADELGAAFAAGDFDGDGEIDLAIGAPGEAIGTGPRAGAVFVYRGTEVGLRPAMVLDQAGLGLDEWGDRLGETMVAADFNDDGFDDLAVGAPGEGYGPAPAVGAVYLFMGTPVGLIPVDTLDQTGIGINEPGDMFAHSLTVGDFDGDGLVDLAVGAPGEAPGEAESSGLVYIYRGTNLGLEPYFALDQTDLGANEDGDWFGAALVGADFNDDGYWDLAVGAPGEAPGNDPSSGAAFIYRGGPMSLQPRQVLTQRDLDHDETGDAFGMTLSAGDYNGDGRDDLAVGAPGENLLEAPDAGAVYVFRGDRTDLVALQRITQTGMGTDESHDRFGASLSSGDYVGDARIDLAIGAPGETRGSDAPSGAVYLMRGFSLGLTTVRAIDQSALDSNEAGDMFGIALK